MAIRRGIMKYRFLIASSDNRRVLVWLLGLYWSPMVSGMTFDEAISTLELEGFYIITLCHKLGPQKFLIMLGKDALVYQGKGNSMMECLNGAMNNCAAGLTYPDKGMRNRVAASLYTNKGDRVELDEKMKEMGWDLT